MPILAAEASLYPDDLLDSLETELERETGWWAIYCMPRREKQLVRHLRGRNVAHYCPLVAKRNTSRSGRVRTSHVPLFPGYVFVCGDTADRHAAITSNCVSQCLEVVDGESLRNDLQQIQRLITHGARLTPEARILPGQRGRIISGPFMGIEGVIIRREGESRLLIAVKYFQRGASILVQDYEVEPL